MMNYMALMGAVVALVVGAFLDLHDDDHGDHPAPAGHLDASGDRRPARHHRSRHARGGSDSRSDWRSHRLGYRNTLGPHRDWSTATGSNPRARSSGRVLAARLRDTSRPEATVLASVVASAMAARQVYKVSPIEALAPVGVSTADRVPRWLRITCGVGAVAVFAASILIVLGRTGTIAVIAMSALFCAEIALGFALTVPIVQATAGNSPSVRIGRGARGGDDRAFAAASVGHRDDRAHRGCHDRHDHRYERRHDPVGARHLLAGRGCRRVGERRSSRPVSHRRSAAGSFREGRRSARRSPRQPRAHSHSLTSAARA